MNLSKDEFKKLLIRYQDGLCTDQECRIVEIWYSSYVDDNSESFSRHRMEENKKEIWQQLEEVTKPRTIFKRIGLLGKVAASITILLGGAIFGWEVYDSMQWVDYRQVEIIEPAKQDGQLILADGNTVDLKKLERGTVLNQGGLLIFREEDGAISYRQESGSLMEDIKYSTLIVPKGHKYSLVLADGSRVTLNAASSIRFPNRFDGQSRKVFAEGKVFFEVEHNADLPFIVETSQQQVEVLGTKFIIDDAEGNDIIKTSLLEGSVRLATLDNTKSILLTPGQQGRWTAAGFVKSRFNTDVETAWLNNDFLFIEHKLPDILKDLEKWYDIETRYDVDLKDVKFSGAISRSKSLQDVLAIMSATGKINFEIRGNTLLAKAANLSNK